MATLKVHFTRERETLLLTLYPKAVQSRWKKPILPDPWADEAIRRIDYDFSKLYGKLTWRLWGHTACVTIASRSATFDALTTGYLADHPDATVLHLGCGLDTRVFRIDPPSGVHWFDVDYADVIDLRRQLYPERPGYRLIGSPLEDVRWLDETPVDRPVLMVAEGVLPYMLEDDVKGLMSAIIEHAPGGQMVFDAMPSWVVRRKASSNVGNTGATYRWALDDPRSINQLEPRLALIRQFTIGERIGYERFGLVMRAIVRAMEVFPALRRYEQILVYRFQATQ